MPLVLAGRIQVSSWEDTAGISYLNYIFLYLGKYNCGGIPMKYVKQFLIILFICFLGELCRYLIPLPIPASIYGLVIMLASLMTGILKDEQVDETALFLVDIMPVMFIPAGAGLLISYNALRPHLTAIIIITVVTTIIVMGVTGMTAQAVINRRNRKEESET